MSFLFFSLEFLRNIQEINFSLFFFYLSLPFKQFHFTYLFVFGGEERKKTRLSFELEMDLSVYTITMGATSLVFSLLLGYWINKYLKKNPDAQTQHENEKDMGLQLQDYLMKQKEYSKETHEKIMYYHSNMPDSELYTFFGKYYRDPICVPEKEILEKINKIQVLDPKMKQDNQWIQENQELFLALSKANDQAIALWMICKDQRLMNAVRDYGGLSGQWAYKALSRQYPQWFK